MFFDPMSLESDNVSRDYSVKNQGNLYIDIDEAWGTRLRECEKRCFSGASTEVSLFLSVSLKMTSLTPKHLGYPFTIVFV